MPTVDVYGLAYNCLAAFLCFSRRIRFRFPMRAITSRTALERSSSGNTFDQAAVIIIIKKG